MAFGSEHTADTAIGTPRPRLLMVGALAAFIGLSGCATDDDVILPGQREGLRAVLEDSDPVLPVENLSAPLQLTAAQSNSDWAQFWGTPSVRTAHPALSSAPQLAWRANIGAGNSRRQRISADPVVGGGLIYTLDAAATVTATTLQGETAWQRDLTPPNDGAGEASGGGITYSDGRVYVGLNFGQLVVLSAETGEEIWTQQLEATASGAPTVFGDLVYLTSGDDTGWALNKDSGRVAWQIGAAQSVSNVAGAPAPVVTNDLAIFAFGSGDVTAVFRRGGLRRWDSSVVGERRGFALAKVSDVTAPPVVSGDRVYAGNQSGRVVALNIGSGDRIWTAQEGASGPIWPAGDSVFFVSDRNELLRLNAADGTRVWGARLPNFVTNRPRRQAEIFPHFGPIVAGGRVVLVSADGLLRSFDPQDGQLVSSVAIPDGAASGPAIAGGVLYVLNTRGELLAYR